MKLNKALLLIVTSIFASPAIAEDYTVVSGESIYFDSGSECGSPAPSFELSPFITLPSHGQLSDQGVRFMSLEDELDECGTQTGVQEERITIYTADLGYVGTDEIVSTDGVNTYNDFITITAPVSDITNDDSDRLFNWVESSYPEYLSPATSQSQEANGYYYRYYTDTNSFIAVKDGHLYFAYYNSSWEILDLGLASGFLALASGAGF